jgi:hypothetical protein
VRLTLLGSDLQPTAATTQSRPTVNAAPLSSAGKSPSCRSDSVTLFLLLDKLDVTDGALTANLAVCVGDNVLAQLEDQPRQVALIRNELAELRAGRVPSAASVNHLMKQLQQAPRPTFAPATVRQVGSEATISIPDFEHPLSLPLLLANPTLSQQGAALTEQIGTVTLSMAGDPQRYPLDSYQSSLGVTVGVPTALVAGSFTTSVEVIADPGVRAFDWSFGTNKSGTTTLRAHRPLTTDLFVLSIAAIPLVVFTLMAVRLFQGSSRPIEGFFAVATIMLTILPIRLVLVPAEITSLTLVDYALGSEMALLAAIAALSYLEPWRAHARSVPR